MLYEFCIYLYQHIGSYLSFRKKVGHWTFMDKYLLKEHWKNTHFIYRYILSHSVWKDESWKLFRIGKILFYYSIELNQKWVFSFNFFISLIWCNNAIIILNVFFCFIKNCELDIWLMTFKKWIIKDVGCIAL